MTSVHVWASSGSKTPVDMTKEKDIIIRREKKKKKKAVGVWIQKLKFRRYHIGYSDTN